MSKISEQQFYQIMNKIKNDQECAEEMRAARKRHNIYNDWFEPYCLFDNNLEELIQVLQIMFDDVENDYIDYYIFECNCDFNNFQIYDDDGILTKVDNLTDLWNLINGEK